MQKVSQCRYFFCYSIHFSININYNILLYSKDYTLAIFHYHCGLPFLGPGFAPILCRKWKCSAEAEGSMNQFAPENNV